jgi:hypothetical protein
MLQIYDPPRSSDIAGCNITARLQVGTANTNFKDQGELYP